MKKSILLLITLFSVTFLYPQTKKKEIDSQNSQDDYFSISNINNATIELYSSLGSHLKTFEHVSSNTIINTGALPNGIYFLKTVDKNRIINKKIIINK